MKRSELEEIIREEIEKYLQENSVSLEEKYDSDGKEKVSVKRYLRQLVMAMIRKIHYAAHLFVGLQKMISQSHRKRL